jgi:hypothetical protein
MKQKLISFSIDIFDLIVYLLAWVSLWYIYDYILLKYVGLDSIKQYKVNLTVFISAIILLLFKNMFIYKYKPW